MDRNTGSVTKELRDSPHVADECGRVVWTATVWHRQRHEGDAVSTAGLRFTFQTEFILFVWTEQRDDHTDAVPRQTGNVIVKPVAATGTSHNTQRTWRGQGNSEHPVSAGTAQWCGSGTSASSRAWDVVQECAI